jgi:hypothetical protein
MNQDQYFQAFFDLLTEAKSVSHFSDRTAEKNHMSSSEFCRRTRLLLAELSDDDFSTFATKIKFSKHFNAIIQAQVAALNRESRRRGLI